MTATIGTLLLSVACNEIADIREPILDLSVSNGGQRDVVVQISTGGLHTCALLNTGKVKCWGWNLYGQCGLGEQGFQGMGLNLPPVDLGTGEKATSISAGAYHTCAVLEGGRLKCWGENISGQLGLGTKNSRGLVSSEMGDKLPAVNVGTGKLVKAVASGFAHTCALLNDASVKCWGSEGAGNTGDEPGEMGDMLPAVDLGAGKLVKAISAGYYHTCALLNDGSVKCWGLNESGQLGLEDWMSRTDPGQMGDALPIVNLGTNAKVKEIAAGKNVTCAVLEDGRVKCWGNNEYGELGQGDNVPRGNAPGEMGENLLAVNLGAGKKAQAITVQSHHVCALLSDNSVKCWGNNGYGQLGLGDALDRGNEPMEMGDSLPAVLLGTDQTVKQINCGEEHSCVVRMDGSVKCWGSAKFGQTGNEGGYTLGDEPGEMGDNLPTLNLVSPK